MRVAFVALVLTFLFGCGGHTAPVLNRDDADAAPSRSPTGSGACPGSAPRAGDACEPSCVRCLGSVCDYSDLGFPQLARCKEGKWHTVDCFGHTAQ